MKIIAAILLVAVPGALAAAPNGVAEGRLLIHRKNCGACHQGLPSGAGGPLMSDVRGRLSSSHLERFIGNPASVKTGTRMPRLFGETDRDLQQVEAITHYLLSIAPAPPQALPLRGDRKRGRDLYHRVGCVACHQADGTEALPASVPIVLGKQYYREALVAYLLEPKTELMPSLKLTRQEASDIAAWLQRDVPTLREEPPAISADFAKEGRALYLSRGCSSCHGAPEENFPKAPPKLAIQNWQRSCLAPQPKPGVPDFALTGAQRDAIRAASGVPLPQEPIEVIDHILGTHRCYACHQRGRKGGPTEARRPFFTVTEQMAESYGDFGNIPPNLDHIGRRLTRTWLRRVLVEGTGDVRPYLATRMPIYNAGFSQDLMDALEAADRRDPPIEIDVSGLPRHQRGHYGRDLLGTKGLNCITCHGLKGQRALGAPNIDLTHTVERLRPAWFKELLLDPQSVQPGTLMPPLFLNRPKANQEVEQLWTYLKELDQRRLPDGLLRTGDFELKPAEAGKPIVLRTFLEQVGAHAVAVGYPQGTHLAFDTRTSQWALLWTGRFLDAMSTWDDRYATPAKPLSEDVYRFLLRKVDRQFRGFRLTASGAPVFLYQENGVRVEDSIVPLPGGQLQRTVKRGTQIKRQEIHLHNRKAFFRDEK